MSNCLSFRSPYIICLIPIVTQNVLSMYKSLLDQIKGSMPFLHASNNLILKYYTQFVFGMDRMFFFEFPHCIKQCVWNMHIVVNSVERCSFAVRS